MMKLSKILLILFLVITACGSGGVEELPAQEILDRAVERMKSAQSFHFLLDREGASAYLDAAHTLAFSRAEGDFVAPDQAKATIRVIVPGLVVEVKVIAMGEEYWETNLLSGKYQKLPPGGGFNPAILFDPQFGFQQILLDDLSNLSLEGVEELEELPGQDLYALSGNLKGENLARLSYGLIGPQEVQARLWVVPQTFEVYRVQLDEPLGEGESASNGKTGTLWQIDFWDFDAVEAIQPPPDE